MTRSSVLDVARSRMRIENPIIADSVEVFGMKMFVALLVLVEKLLGGLEIESLMISILGISMHCWAQVGGAGS